MWCVKGVIMVCGGLSCDVGGAVMWCMRDGHVVCEGRPYIM